jgi:hypothetical protein
MQSVAETRNRQQKWKGKGDKEYNEFTAELQFCGTQLSVEM